MVRAFDCINSPYRDYLDKIEFRGFDGDGNFIVSVKRKYGPIASTAYTYFNICIPMVGDIGVRAFNEEEGPNKCWAFVRRYICDNKTMYYFWIAKNDSQIEPPKMNPDPEKYHVLYTVSGNEKDVYYIAQNQDDIDSDNAWCFIPATISQEIPYIFWGHPLSYKIDLEFGTGSCTIGWCNYNGDYFKTNEYQYSSFDGSYIVSAGGNSGGLFPYWGSANYNLNLDDIGEIQTCVTQSGILNYGTLIFNMSFTISTNPYGEVGNDPRQLEIHLGGGFYFLGDSNKFQGYGVSNAASAQYKFPFSIPVHDLSCVDERILTGKYGELVYAYSGAGYNSTCPNITDIQNFRCGISVGWSALSPKVTCTVHKWKVLGGCV